MTEQLREQIARQSRKAWDNALDNPISFFNQPTTGEILDIRLKIVNDATLKLISKRVKGIENNWNGEMGLSLINSDRRYGFDRAIRAVLRELE